MTAIVEQLRNYINNCCKGLEPSQVVLYTSGSCLLLHYIKGLYHGSSQTWRLSLYERAKGTFFKLLWSIGPLKKSLVDKPMDEAAAGFKKDFAAKDGEGSYTELPAKGLSASAVLALIDKRDKVMVAPHAWQNGKTSGTVYHGSEALSNLVLEAIKRTMWTNPLHATTFPMTRKMEAEIIAMVVRLYRGDDKAVGTMTSGGTESIMMAMRTYREYGREVRGIHEPVIITASSVHPAFDKAADFLGMRIIHIPVLADGRADVAKMISKIDGNTVCLVGSAPSYAVGVIDDIPALSAAAVKRGVGLHVDCCLGSFVVPFLRDAGVTETPDFDFSLPGVTTISCDTHKYGYGPKGTSVVMHRNAELRRHQYFCLPDWNGGVYATPTFAGSRAGNIIAATWAVMMHMGYEGYQSCAKDIINMTRYVAREAAKIEGLYVLGHKDPKEDAGLGLVQTVSLASNEYDIYCVSEKMEKLGWELQPLQFPNGLHWGITHVATQKNVADAFISDLKTVMKELYALPEDQRKPTGALKMYCSTQEVPDRALVKQAVFRYFDAVYDA